MFYGTLMTDKTNTKTVAHLSLDARAKKTEVIDSMYST